MSAADVSRAMMRAFHEQDADLARSILADDFTITSPQDDHLDRDAWFEKCFPSVEHFEPGTHELTDVREAGEHVLLRYEYALPDGTRWANAERHVVRGGLIHEVEVYFGGELR